MKKRTQAFVLLLPVILFMIFALVLQLREAQLANLKHDIVGRWQAASGSGTIIQIDGNGTGTVLRNGKHKVARKISFVDKNHIRISGPDMPVSGVVAEIGIYNDNLTFTFGANSPVSEAYKRLS